MKWAVQKLEEIVSIKTGKLDSNAAVPNGQYPFFTCDPQTLAINTYAYDTEAVLLAGNNASGNYTAKYYHGKFNAYQRTYIIESIDKGKLDIHYFLYALNEQLALLKSISSGSTTKFLTMSMLKPLSVPCPTISVQHRIASILSAYDDLIENNRRQIKLLEEAAQRLYREWFVELRFPGHEGVKVMDGVPEGWKIETVGSLLRKIPRTKQILTSDYQVSGNIPIVDQSRDFIAGYTNDTDACVKPQDAIIVFGDHTRILKYITFPFAKGADGTQLIVSNSDCMPQSLFYFSIIHIDLTNYHYARHFKYLKESTILVPTKSIATVYKGNIIKNLIMDCQSYTKYRPNETTGGIFVSWRRKEELPTGA